MTRDFKVVQRVSVGCMPGSSLYGQEGMSTVFVDEVEYFMPGWKGELIDSTQHEDYDWDRHYLYRDNDKDLYWEASQGGSTDVSESSEMDLHVRKGDDFIHIISGNLGRYELIRVDVSSGEVHFAISDQSERKSFDDVVKEVKWKKAIKMEEYDAFLHEKMRL